MAWADATVIDAADFRVDGRGSVDGGAFDLTHWRQAVGAPISLDSLLTDSARLLDWLGVQDAAPGATPLAMPLPSRQDIAERVEQWQLEIAALPPSPPLLYAADMVLAWRRRSPIGRGDVVASLLVGDRYGPGRWDASFGGLVALGFQSSGTAWKIAERDRFERLWLHAIVQGADAHLDQEQRLRAYADRAATFITSRRRPGRLKEVILLAMARPYVTSRMVADTLRLTAAGAIKLLTIAAEAGLLLERSGQSSYRTYAIPVAGSRSGVQLQPAADAFHDDLWNDD